MAYAEAVAEAASLHSADEVSGVHTAETEAEAGVEAEAAAGFEVTESDPEAEAVLVTAANDGGVAAAVVVANAVDSKLVSQQH